MKLGFLIEIVKGQAADIKTDVLMIKHAPYAGGFEARIKSELRKAGNTLLEDDPPGLGDYRLIEAPKGFRCRYILSVGTVSVFHLGYAAIRKLGYDMLASLHKAGIEVTDVLTTLHGVNTAAGNDEVEAFRSLLLGFADAFEGGRVPPSLKRVTIVERESYRVVLMQEALNKFIPPPTFVGEETQTQLLNLLQYIKSKDAEPHWMKGIASIDTRYRKPVADERTPNVFVAMPFADHFDDHYYLAIRPAITENNLLSVRLDQKDSAFTGDIMETIKERVRSARLLVALLDSGNPNVYLEVGFAWGVGTPTVLVLHDNEQPPFDVRGSRLIRYNRIHKLKEDLFDEIRYLLRQH